MSSERVLVAAHFLRLTQRELSFESALEIVEKEFAQKGAFVRDEIYITKATGGNKDKCFGCEKYNVTYGNDMMKLCAKCLLPKEIYEKHLAPPPIRIVKREDVALPTISDMITLLKSERGK